MQKSCAACPIFCSGEGKPIFSRIARFNHGPESAAGGHIPSERPARITISAVCNRVSNNSQINTRGCTPEGSPL